MLCYLMSQVRMNYILKNLSSVCPIAIVMASVRFLFIFMVPRLTFARYSLRTFLSMMVVQAQALHIALNNQVSSPLRTTLIK